MRTPLPAPRVQPTTNLAPLMDDGPRDCVRLHRTVGSDCITMVGYDEAGEIQIEVRLKVGRLSTRWQDWILRWMRGWYRKQLKLVK